ncbi:hypothetical protein BDW74DRAFT_30280 [Aspergillus multicolor]|uniref:uncharacterized protein n=1 Tax=Aspergillus multicolor TaxID=41759 RepID=UPI003CCD4885
MSDVAVSSLANIMTLMDVNVQTCYDYCCPFPLKSHHTGDPPPQATDANCKDLEILSPSRKTPDGGLRSIYFITFVQPKSLPPELRSNMPSKYRLTIAGWVFHRDLLKLEYLANAIPLSTWWRAHTELPNLSRSWLTGCLDLLPAHAHSLTRRDLERPKDSELEPRNPHPHQL